jgi:hypothetical protein
MYAVHVPVLPPANKQKPRAHSRVLTLQLSPALPIVIGLHVNVSAHARPSPQVFVETTNGGYWTGRHVSPSPLFAVHLPMTQAVPCAHGAEASEQAPPTARGRAQIFEAGSLDIC